MATKKSSLDLITVLEVVCPNPIKIMVAEDHLYCHDDCPFNIEINCIQKCDLFQKELKRKNSFHYKRCKSCLRAQK